MLEEIGTCPHRRKSLDANKRAFNNVLDSCSAEGSEAKVKWIELSETAQTFRFQDRRHQLAINGGTF